MIHRATRGFSDRELQCAVIWPSGQANSAHARPVCLSAPSITAALYVVQLMKPGGGSHTPRHLAFRRRAANICVLVALTYVRGGGVRTELTVTAVSQYSH